MGPLHSIPVFLRSLKSDGGGRGGEATGLDPNHGLPLTLWDFGPIQYPFWVSVSPSLK